MMNTTRRDLLIAAGLATMAPRLGHAQEAEAMAGTQTAMATGGGEGGLTIQQLRNRTVITGDEVSLQQFLQIAEQAKKLPAYAGSMDIAAIRQGGEAFAGSPLAYPVPDGVEREWVDAGGVRACWFRRPETSGAAPVLYLHGGGYVAGSVEASRGIAAKLVDSLAAPVLAVAYRQAPEAPYPAAVEDCVAAYEWLTSQSDQQPGIVGDSVGGALAIGTALHAARNQMRPARYAIAMSAWIDFSLSGYSWLANRDKDLVTVKLGQFFADSYLAGTDPAEASKFFFDQLELAPPILVQMGGVEGPLDSTVAYVERARAAGVAVDLEVYTDLPHNFAKFRNPVCDVAYARMALWTRSIGNP